MYKKIVLAGLLLSATLQAQERRREPAVLHEVSNKEVVLSVFPKAEKVEKVNDYWFRVLDAKGKLLGFAMNSTPYCQDVKGYANLTPVMIITDKKWKIQKVALLSNYESPRWVDKLVMRGFFDSWNGKTVKEAQAVQVDAHTGATYTATAVIKNVGFLLENGAKVLPNK